MLNPNNYAYLVPFIKKKPNLSKYENEIEQNLEKAVRLPQTQEYQEKQ